MTTPITKRPPKATRQAEERENARQALRQMLPPGSTVYTILRHVSRSGMMRHISLKVQTPEGLRDVTYQAAQVLGYPLTKTGDVALKVRGCGMDMGFAVVYDLSARLWSEPGQAGDAGYNLRQEWL